eukprot:GHVT01035499.1.p1 GENE.GHVT01035499.1~~GHVT01035499.1.p1  ORF type:complete len:117 (-),score=18.32 GHVT01035499.1:432-782(-)
MLTCKDADKLLDSSCYRQKSFRTDSHVHSLVPAAPPSKSHCCFGATVVVSGVHPLRAAEVTGAGLGSRRVQAMHLKPETSGLSMGVGKAPRSPLPASARSAPAPNSSLLRDSQVVS